MAPIPGAPSVGDCVLQPNNGATATTEDAAGALRYESLSASPCTGARYGEVASIIPADQVQPPGSVTPDSTDATDPGDPNLNLCNSRATALLGVGKPDTPQVLFTYWSPAVNVGSMVVGPTPLQLAMGQHWLACLSFVIGLDGQSVRYDRPLAQTFRAGAPPPAFAMCVMSADPTSVLIVRCMQPHEAEVIGYGDPAASPTALQATCEQLVKKVTGMADPTASGQLKIYSTTPTPPTDTGFSESPVCMITTARAGHELVGPLLGLESRPVPLK